MRVEKSSGLSVITGLCQSCAISPILLWAESLGTTKVGRMPTMMSLGLHLSFCRWCSSVGFVRLWPPVHTVYNWMWQQGWGSALEKWWIAPLRLGLSHCPKWRSYDHELWAVTEIMRPWIQAGGGDPRADPEHAGGLSHLAWECLSIRTWHG